MENDNIDILSLTTEIVSAFASNNQISAADMSDFIRSVHGTLQSLEDGVGGMADAMAEETSMAPASPAVPIDASVGRDAIICLDCGKPFKTLKRHLSAEHNLDPVAYRERWGLSKDYPLVAPSYSKKRAATAKKIGLGRKKAK